MQSEDFVIVANDVHEVMENGRRVVKFRIQVPDRVVSAQETGYDGDQLDEILGTWESTPPTLADIVQVGELLGQALFPAGQIRDAFLSSLSAHKNSVDSRLRLILNLEGLLNNLPWEFVLFRTEMGEATQNAMLALMSQVSIVRRVDRTVPNLTGIKAVGIPAQMVVALANPKGSPKLALGKEREFIKQSAGQSDRIQVTWVEHASRDTLLGGLEQVHLFHFAGHGTFVEAPTPGSVSGVGAVLLEKDEQATQDVLLASELAPRLAAAGVRVVLLGACLTARRDDVNLWSSTAANLLNAGVGAVVAMQYAIRDASAIAFAKAFYTALVKGYPVDQAVTRGRLAIFEKSDFRGFGTPILYMGQGDGVVFPEYTSDPLLQAEREKIQLVVNVGADIVEGRVIGIQIDKMKSGEATAKVTTVEIKEGGEVFGLVAGSLTGGDVDVEVTAQTVRKNALLVGAFIGSTPPRSIHRPGSSSRGKQH